MTGYVPVAVPVGTVTVNVDVPEIVGVIDMGLGLGLVVSPFAVEESKTLPVNPLMEFTVIVEVPVNPALKVIGLGDAEMVKS